MIKEETKRILQDMEKHGFPLEIRTSETLKNTGWTLRNQVGYIDSEQGVHRTIDIVATQPILEKPTEYSSELWLVTECKKNAKPWVFNVSEFKTDPRADRFNTFVPVQDYIYEQAYQAHYHEKIRSAIVDKFWLQKRLFQPIFTKIAHIPFEPFTEGKGESIHRAQMQLCNSIIYFQEQLNRINFPSAVIFVPVIVFDGRLYAYQNGGLELTQGLFYEVNYQESMFFIEIVTIDFLEKYLKNLGDRIKAFQKAWGSPSQ
jgi:hypothetical protein